MIEIEKNVLEKTSHELSDKHLFFTISHEFLIDILLMNIL